MLSTPSLLTLCEAAETWLEGARAGSIRNRSGERYMLRHGRPGVLGHVFGRPDGKPFDGPAVDARAKAALGQAGLDPITLHEAQHTFASLTSAAAR